MKISVALLAMSLLAPTPCAFADEDIDRPGIGDWCYDPVHQATPAERRSFVERIGTKAVALESEFGAPAPILTGMAFQVLGYGFTRLALKSNGVLSLTWPGEPLAGGRTTFVLWCQPAYDPDNRYPVFHGFEDAMTFVARRLATSQHYAADTKPYVENLKAGVDKKTAATTWLQGLANPYNQNPRKYVQDILARVEHPAGPNSENLWSLQP